MLDKEATELLHAAIDTAHDFLGGPDPSIPTPLVCIKVPDLPHFTTDHIDRHEQGQLAAEFMDWMLTGNRDGALLRRKALSIEYEREYRKYKKDLRQARTKRKRHRNSPADQDDKKAMSIWEREDVRLARTIEDLEERVKQADRERAKRKPILQQLEASETCRARVRKFREQTAKAHGEGKRLIFSLLASADSEVFCTYLDRAFSTMVGRVSRRSDTSRQGVKWLRSASFLLTLTLTARAASSGQSRAQGFGSITEQQLRDFAIEAEADGTEHRASSLEPPHPAGEDRRETEFAHLDALADTSGCPVRVGAEALLCLVRQWSGKKEPRPDDFLHYAFEHAAYLGEPALQSILLVLRELGLSDVPARCKELSAERFNHAPAILGQFQVYERGAYSAQQAGNALPAVFKDDRHARRLPASLHLDAFGMGDEVAQPPAYLLDRGIACPAS